MSKKKFKKMLRKAMKNGYGGGVAGVPDNSFGFGAEAGDGFASPNGFGYGSDGGGFGRNLLGGLGLPRGFGSGQTEQFILGALLGAAAAYVLADEALRSKIMKTVVKLYSGLTGGMEEFKEQMADLKAEIEAERGV